MLGANRVVRGVITVIPIDEDLDKLKRSIQGGNVLRLKRLMRTINREKTESLSVLLEFQGSVLPERVKVGCMSFPVRVYVPPPLHSYTCERYGHVAAVFKGKQRCPMCGGDHIYAECVENAEPKCCNCGGHHTVGYGGCEVRKRAVKIQQCKTINNISVKEQERSIKIS